MRRTAVTLAARVPTPQPGRLSFAALQAAVPRCVPRLAGGRAGGGFGTSGVPAAEPTRRRHCTHTAFVLCQLQDRAQLSSCCSALLACSQQHNAAWWGSSLDLSLLSQQGARVAALTAWLARCRPNLSQLRVLMPHNYDHDFAERAGFYVADERLRAAVTLPSPPRELQPPAHPAD